MTTATKTTATINGLTFELSAKLTETGAQFPNADQNSQTRHNKFRVTVKHNGRRVYFNFYDSHHKWEAGHVEMTEREILFAFYCFLSDGGAANENFADFCASFCYDTDSRRAYSIYQTCVKTLQKFRKLCPRANICDMVNELTENYNF